MALARVWNEGPTDYSEVFKGETIRIPRGKYIEMDQFEGNQFVSAYTPVKKDGVGNYLTHKMLRLEVLPSKEERKVEHRCQMCRGVFDTENELVLHSEAYHKEAIIDDKAKGKK